VYTDSAVRGGAEESLGTLIAGLGPHVEVTVVGVDRGVVEWLAARRRGSASVVLPPVRNKLGVGAILAHVRAVRRLRPDVLHANLPATFTCQYGILAGLLARVPVVVVEASPIGGDSRLQRRLKRALSTRIAAHVAPGERSARTVEQVVGLPAGSVRTIYNGVTDTGPAPREHAGRGAVVGALGRLSREKGMDVLVRALALLPVGTRAVVVGDGPERASLERLAAELGVTDRLELPGWEDDARARLATFDVLALPSRFEAFPLAILEAMLAGVPVVATDVGSVVEAVADGETGLLVPPDDPEALAATLERLLADGELRARFGRSARVRAELQFTASVQARSFEALYEEIRR
jgi:glycosyltransferase involved in cell wall biosynthesis